MDGPAPAPVRRRRHRRRPTSSRSGPRRRLLGRPARRLGPRAPRPGRTGSPPRARTSTSAPRSSSSSSWPSCWPRRTTRSTGRRAALRDAPRPARRPAAATSCPSWRVRRARPAACRCGPTWARRCRSALAAISPRHGVRVVPGHRVRRSTAASSGTCGSRSARRPTTCARAVDGLASAWAGLGVTEPVAGPAAGPRDGVSGVEISGSVERRGRLARPRAAGRTACTPCAASARQCSPTHCSASYCVVNTGLTGRSSAAPSAPSNRHSHCGRSTITRPPSAGSRAAPGRPRARA